MTGRPIQQRQAARRAVDANLVRDALAYIPADIGHDERARIAFAVYDGLGDAGADAWFAWADQRPTPDQAEDRATWRLRDMGLQMASGTKARSLIGQYIDTRKPEDRVTCVDRVGWHGGVYVLPSDCIGETEGQRYAFQSEAGMEDTYRSAGTLAQWQANLAAHCVGNSRLVFALACAFAGPMTRLAEMESGGFHLRGDSSMGKTTALRLAASVWGRPSYMQRWRTTDNALEATAVQHCDSLLILDEFGQLDPKVAGECAYMLANDQEKGRATRNGFARKRRTWRLLFLSSGELSLAQHMESVSKTPRAGQEVRMLDIPLDAGAGMGGLEELHGHGGPAALADALVTAAAKTYGVAGRAWLEWACKHHAELPARLEALIKEYRDDFVPESAAEQVRRAGARFALVAAAGELATEAGITGWPAGEAHKALRRCFNAWLESRGHAGNGEEQTMYRQVRKFFELHGAGRFSWWHRAADDHSPNTLMRAGFKRMVDAAGKAVRTNSDHQREFGERMQPEDGDGTSIEFFVLPEVFRSEVCAGFDYRAVCRVLAQRGHLELGPHNRFDRRERLPGIGPSLCYRVKASIFSEITGWALSIASVIAMAGKRILLAPSGLVMVHNPWSTTSGNAAELRRMADTLDVVRGTLVKAYQRTGKSDAVILKWLDAETWFDADQARDAGLIDGVINESTEQPAGANACAFRIPDHLKARILNMQTTTTTTTAPNNNDAVQAGIRAEHERQSSIRAVYERHLHRDRTRATLNAVLADPSCDLVQAKARLLEALAYGTEPAAGGWTVDVNNWNNAPTGYGSSYSGSHGDQLSDFMAAASDVLLARAGVPVQNPHPASRDVERLSVVAMAERMLSMSGVSTSRKSQNEIIRAAFSTADFPELLANTTNRALRAGYDNAPATHAAWTAEREVPDFKPQTMVALSEAPSLDRIEELGEYKHANFSEAAESFRVETFGKIVKISRQALINDDLGAFTRIPQAYGASARRLESDSVYAKLTGDTRLRDNLPLFDAKHGNLAAVASALSADSLGAARAAMRRQKGLDGLGYFDPQPRFLLVPVVMETKAEQLLASLVDPAMANNTGNPEWIRRLVLVSDPRLDEVSETAWYLAADPNQHDTIVRAYLAGEPRPYLEENSEFERDAIGHKCRLDFGVGVIDYRGLYKNAGK